MVLRNHNTLHYRSQVHVTYVVCVKGFSHTCNNVMFLMLLMISNRHRNVIAHKTKCTIASEDFTWF